MTETVFTHMIETDDYVIVARSPKDNNLVVDFEIYEKFVFHHHVEPHHEFNGHVKWDGCMNWQTNDNCMAHLCDTYGLEAMSLAFKAAWVLGSYIMGDEADYDETDNELWNLVKRI